MNYLAHLYFSDRQPLAWAGSLMGDFHKGRDFGDLPEELVRHLRLHRFIDGLTRSSRFFQNSRRRLDPGLGHGRSVLVDVFYDHLLACCWDDFCGTPLPVFAQHVYHGLEACHKLLSPGLQRQLPHMISHNWLVSYGQPDIVQRVLVRLEQRLGGKLPLADGFAQLGLHRGELEKDFILFMTETRKQVARWKEIH